MPITHVRYCLYDVSGNLIETKTAPLAIAAAAISDFMHILVVDPEEDGAGSQGGRISFEPAPTPRWYQAKCPDCGTDVGEEHGDGCETDLMPLIWTGEWPGDMECIEFGWWSVRNPDGPGWISVPAGTPDATPDLNRLYREAKWDKDQARWVKKDGS